ncbi:MAG TPA: hypothetical protein VGC41_18725 [Kofleriaceae bacterium]
MRIAWALLVSWCMVVSTARYHTWEKAHTGGVSVAARYNHPLRHRYGTSHVFVAIVPPDRTIVIVPRPFEVVQTEPTDPTIDVVPMTDVSARGPPMG